MNPRRTLSLTIWIAIVFSFLAGCSGGTVKQIETAKPAAAANTPTAEVTIWPGENWGASTPEQQGMDSEQLARMLAWVVQENVRLHSILIVRNGRLVLETYFNPYEAETHHQMASITKSVMGALVGIAIEQGKIESVEQPVVNFFKDRQIANLDERKGAMTLEHLLMLAPGLECEDAKGTEAQMMQSQDWTQFVLDLPMAAEPGTKWAYCSSAVHLVSAILQKATGMDARTYANQYLFEPIGIKDVPPERWPSDPQGITTGGSGLFLTPAEIARFAYLYLNNGRWGEQQVVPAEWVAASTTPHIKVGKMKAYGDMNRSYGYLWSLYPEGKFYSALGRNGQHIHVFPQDNLVVVFTSATSLFSDENQFKLLKEYIQPSIKSKTALPENLEGTAKLQARVEEAARPLQRIAELPAAGQTLNGRTIRIGENSYGWERMDVTFTDRESSAEIRIDNGEPISVGLDNLYRVQEIPELGSVGFRGTWERPDRFTIQEVILGTWMEFEISLTIEGDQVTIFQRNVVDGGDLVRMVGEIKD